MHCFLHAIIRQDSTSGDRPYETQNAGREGHRGSITRLIGPRTSVTCERCSGGLERHGLSAVYFAVTGAFGRFAGGADDSKASYIVLNPREQTSRTNRRDRGLNRTVNPDDCALRLPFYDREYGEM